MTNPGNILPVRGELTDDFLAYLVDALAGVCAVGDGVKPDDAGWAGQPNASDYAPYITVGTGDAVVHNAPTLRSAMSSWACGYTVKFFGAARKQADDIADVVRTASLGYAPRTVSLGDIEWSVGTVRYDRLGKIDREDAEDPPVWSGTDVLALWIDAPRR